MNPQYPDVSNIYANPSGASVPSTSSIANIYADPSQQAPVQPTSVGNNPAHSGNFLTHLLPTGGAIAGGAAGAAAGTAILPGIGTFLGGVLGAALGGGGAKAAENVSEGKGAGNDVVDTALESGAGQAVGGVAGKVLGKGAELLAGRAGNLADQTAAQQAIDNRALATSGIKQARQAELNANNSLDHVTNMGFDETNPEQVQAVANNSNDVLNGVLDKALANSGTFDLSTYPQMVKDALAKQSPILGGYEPVALSRGRLGIPNTPAGKLLTPLQNLGAGVAKMDSDPNQIRTLTTQLGDTMQKYRGSDLPEDKATYAAINDIRNTVKNSLYNRPEVNEALQGTPGNVTAEDVGSQQLADHLNNIISTAGTTGNTPAQDLLTNISHNINISDLGDEMSKVRQVASTTSAQARAAADAGIQNANTNAVLDAGTNVGGHGGIIPTVLATAKHVKDNPQILNTLSRIGALGEKLAPGAGAAVGSGNAELQSNGTMGDMNGAALPQQQTGDMMASSTTPAGSGGLSRDDLITLALYAPDAFSSLVTPSAANQQSVSAANTAEQALSSLGPAPGGGILSQVAGHLGLGATGEYQRKAANVAQQVATALPGADASTIERELTAYNAGSGAVNQSIQQLLANLQAVKQNNTNGAYQQLVNYQPSVVSAAGL